MADTIEYVTVYEANGQLAGEMVRLLLEANEIPCLVTQESYGRSLGITIGRLGIARIMVPRGQQAAARVLIREMEQGHLDGIHYPGRYIEKPSYKPNKSARDDTLKG